MGYLNAYVDLFYITSETTPSKIEPSEKLKEEYSLNKRTKKKFEQTEAKLREMS